MTSALIAYCSVCLLPCTALRALDSPSTQLHGDAYGDFRRCRDISLILCEDVMLCVRVSIILLSGTLCLLCYFVANGPYRLAVLDGSQQYKPLTNKHEQC